MKVETLLDVVGFALERTEKGTATLNGKKFTCMTANGDHLSKLLDEMKEGDVVFVSIPTTYCEIRNTILGNKKEG